MRMELTIAGYNIEEEIKLISSERDNVLQCVLMSY